MQTTNESIPRRRVTDLWIPIASWAAVALAVGRIQYATNVVARDHRPFRWSLLVGDWFTDLGKLGWDSGLYLNIAREGYGRHLGREAAFPLYALLIRWVTRLTHDDVHTSMWIAALAGLAATVLFWAWSGQRGLPRRERLIALWLFLLWPYGFLMFGVAYSDPLLLAFVVGSLLLVEQRHYAAAGLVGALATITRPNALVLIAVLIVIALEQAGALQAPPRRGATEPRSTWLRSTASFWRGIRLDRSHLSPRLAGVGLAALGVGSYSLFLTFKVHDPVYFWTVQAQYGHRGLLDPLTWVKANLVLLHDVVDGPASIANEIVCFLILVAAAVATPRIGRRFGWGYAVLVAGLVVTTWGTAQYFAPSGRYLLPAVPVLAAAAAGWLAPRRILTAAVLVAFAVGSLTLAAGFAGAFDINW